VPPRSTVDPGTDQATGILHAASELLAKEGADALTVRRIASHAGCSTMGVYTSFGGKDGVVDALFREGFELLRDRMSRVRATSSPLGDLRRCSQAYRAMALAHPTHYAVMFERVVAGYRPSDQSVEAAHRTLAVLEGRVERAIELGALPPGDPVAIAHSLWATAHGLVTLELHGLGHTEDRRRNFDLTIDALLRGLSQGDRP
jgi:AcrR family transcriptional regulator